MSKEIKSEIVDTIMDAANAFHSETGNPAKAVYLTRDIEKKVEQLTSDDIGALSEEIFLKGARAAMPKIFGFNIKSWDSDTLKVE